MLRLLNLAGCIGASPKIIARPRGPSWRPRAARATTSRLIRWLLGNPSRARLEAFDVLKSLGGILGQAEEHDALQILGHVRAKPRGGHERVAGVRDHHAENILSLELRPASQEERGHRPQGEVVSPNVGRPFPSMTATQGARGSVPDSPHRQVVVRLNRWRVPRVDPTHRSRRSNVNSSLSLPGSAPLSRTLPVGLGSSREPGGLLRSPVPIELSRRPLATIAENNYAILRNGASPRFGEKRR